jgi:hypothetical protein
MQQSAHKDQQSGRGTYAALFCSFRRVLATPGSFSSLLLIRGACSVFWPSESSRSTVRLEVLPSSGPVNGMEMSDSSWGLGINGSMRNSS